MGSEQMKTHLKIGKEAIKQEAKGLQALAEKLDRRFELAAEVLSERRIVFLTGVGKSGQVAKKLASTMISLGTPAVFLHPTEAAHGDLGIVTPEDAIIALSRSGNAVELHSVIDYGNNIGCHTIMISENSYGRVSTKCDIVLELPKISEAWGHAPTTSTVMQMAYGDALAITLAEIKGYKWEDFKKIHPAGDLQKLI